MTHDENAAGALEDVLDAKVLEGGAEGDAEAGGAIEGVDGAGRG